MFESTRRGCHHGHVPDGPQPPPAPAEPSTPAPWPPWQRVLFRFASCYFILYTLPTERRFWAYGPVGHVFGTRWLFQLSMRFWKPIDLWFASVLRMSSQDVGLAVVEITALLIISAMAAVIWSLLDRKRAQYVTLHAWLRVWLRYCLAFTLFGYGFTKVFPLQMQVNPVDLVSRWGDLTPFDALWSFMSVSKPYQILCGVLEVAAGLLLLFRRTTPLGAALALAATVNITALDFFYDVPPMFFALHLALISLLLLMPDFSRLAGVFFLNRPAPAADLSRPVFSRGWMCCVARAIWIYAVASVIIGDVVYTALRYKRVFLDPQPPLRGLYEVQDFIRNGNDVPALITNRDNWRWFYVYSSNKVASISLTGDSIWYDVKPGPETNILTLVAGTGSNVFEYSWTDTNQLVLRAADGKDPVVVRLRKVDLNSFRVLGHTPH